jgi:integrase
MRIYRRGKFYWYEFVYNGQRIQRSSHFTNQKAAYDAMTAERQRRIRGESVASSAVPTLQVFQTTFMEWVCSTTDSERTRQFYDTCYRRLCEFQPLGKARLDHIDEGVIEAFKLTVLKQRTRTTCNRYLATLKKALRYAWRKRRLITRMPVIELYPNEPGREYVYSDDEYDAWLQIAPEPLRSASVLVRECGICRGELLALQKDCVHLNNYEDGHGFWGMLNIRRGLKRAARRRDLPITRDMAIVLRKLLSRSECSYVFTAWDDHTQPLSKNTLADQHRRVMGTGEFNSDAGLHSLRHTFLTEAGRHTQNVRALQRLAGHSRVETTARYIHPEQRDIDEISGLVQQSRRERAEAGHDVMTKDVPTISPTVN